MTTDPDCIPPVPTEEGLKPCPFCGGRDVVLRHGSQMPGWDEDVCAHQCRKCEATGPTMLRRREDGPEWNTRPTQTPQDVAGLVEHPITMQDVRLAVGEGPLKPHDVLAGCNAELRRRAALRPSPISHESKGLELAAADARRGTGPLSDLMAEMLSALKGVVAVADRSTIEFDAARAAIAKAEAAQ